LADWLIGVVGLNGIFNINRLYRALLSMLQLKSEINKNVDNLVLRIHTKNHLRAPICVQLGGRGANTFLTITINNSSIWSL